MTDCSPASTTTATSSPPSSNVCDNVTLSPGVYYLNFPAGKDEWRLDKNVVGPACDARRPGRADRLRRQRAHRALRHAHDPVRPQRDTERSEYRALRPEVRHRRDPEHELHAATQVATSATTPAFDTAAGDDHDGRRQLPAGRHDGKRLRCQRQRRPSVVSDRAQRSRVCRSLASSSHSARGKQQGIGQCARRQPADNSSCAYR